MLMVSACLIGLNTRYNGEHNLDRQVLALGQLVPLIPVCPEQLGGLPTPRAAAEISGGDGRDVLAGHATVKAGSGADFSEAFVKGARETLHLARILGIWGALLKARSPSCGNCRIYDGTFSGQIRDGAGVTAALLMENGFNVFNEEQYGELKEFLAHFLQGEET